MKWTTIFAALIAITTLTLASQEAKACSPPPDLWTMPYSSELSPVPIAQATPALHFQVDSNWTELTQDNLGFELRAVDDQGAISDPLPLSYSAHLESSTRLRVAVDVDELESGRYQVTLVPSFDANYFEEKLHFEIVEENFSVAIEGINPRLRTFPGGTRYCCELPESDCIGLCSIEEVCEDCFYDHELSSYLLNIDFAVHNGQADVEVRLNGDLIRTTSALHRATRVSLELEPEDAPYCVELTFLDMLGNVVGELHETCLDASDFPELSGPVPVLRRANQRCLADPVVIDGDDDDENENVEDNDEESPDHQESVNEINTDESVSCSTAGATNAWPALLMLGLVGLLRRRDNE